MSRPFEFSDKTQNEAFFRQWHLCAHCGRDLIDLDENAHHVIPNQSGEPGQPDDKWIKTSENCVVLCNTCHYAVHDGGKFKNGGVAPPSYFPYSHGRQRGQHLAWVANMDSRIRALWPSKVV